MNTASIGLFFIGVLVGIGLAYFTFLPRYEHTKLSELFGRGTNPPPTYARPPAPPAPPPGTASPYGTPSAAMLRAAELAYDRCLERYGHLNAGGRIQMFVDVWRAMSAVKKAQDANL